MHNWKSDRDIQLCGFVWSLVSGPTHGESKSSMNFHLPNSNRAHFVAILVHIACIVDHVGAVVHETADDAARLLGETLAVGAGKGERLLLDGALDDEGWAVFDLDLGVLVHVVLGPALDEDDVAVLDVAGDGVLVGGVLVQARKVNALIVKLELGTAG